MFWAFVLMVGVSACQEGGRNSNEANMEATTYATLPPDSYEKKLAELTGAQLIDVRTSGEYNSGHLPHAENMDINGGDFEELASTLDKSSPVFVYCKSGGRSANALEVLQAMGFKQVYNLKGGILAWQAEGKSLDEASEAPLAGMTQADIDKLARQKKYVLIDYNATWCGPCKKMMPILDNVAKKRSDSLLLVKVDADENAGLMQQKQISGIPYIELYKDGKLVWQYTGMISEEGILAETGL